MAIRFKRIESETQWKTMVPNYKITNQKHFAYRGLIMTPTSHDITEESIDAGIKLYKKLLEVGNELLIVTKPKLSLIERLTDELEPYQEQITFRFTITSINNDLLSYFEPGASKYEERYESVFDAYDNGWKISVLIEPFLDEDPTYLITRFFDPTIITDTIWLGIMNPAFIHYFKDRLPANFLERYSYKNLQKIISKLNGFPSKIKDKIRLKDSIRNLGFEISANQKLKCPHCGKELGNLNEKEVFCCCNRLFFVEKNKQKTLDQFVSKIN